MSNQVTINRKPMTASQIEARHVSSVIKRALAAVDEYPQPRKVKKTHFVVAVAGNKSVTRPVESQEEAQMTIQKRLDEGADVVYVSPQGVYYCDVDCGNVKVAVKSPFAEVKPVKEEVYVPYQRADMMI
jgi:(2Fe-2S) ferredoxin